MDRNMTLNISTEVVKFPIATIIVIQVDSNYFFLLVNKYMFGRMNIKNFFFEKNKTSKSS
jgi:hypothetical protein